MIKGSRDKSSCSGMLTVFTRLGQGALLGAGCWRAQEQPVLQAGVLLTALM